MSRKIAGEIESLLSSWSAYEATTQAEITALETNRAAIETAGWDVDSAKTTLTTRRTTALEKLGDPGGRGYGSTVFGQWQAFNDHKSQTEAMQSHSDGWDDLLKEVADLDAKVQQSKAKDGGWSSASAEAFYGQLPVQAQAVMDAKTIMTGLKQGMQNASTLHESIFSNLHGLVQQYVSHYNQMGCTAFVATNPSTWGKAISWGATNFGPLVSAMEKLYQGDGSWRPGNNTIATGFENNTTSFYTEGNWPISANPNVNPEQQASNQASSAANMANPNAGGPGPQDSDGMAGDAKKK